MGKWYVIAREKKNISVEHITVVSSVVGLQLLSVVYSVQNRALFCELKDQGLGVSVRMLDMFFWQISNFLKDSTGFVYGLQTL